MERGFDHAPDAAAVAHRHVARAPRLFRLPHRLPGAAGRIRADGEFRHVLRQVPVFIQQSPEPVRGGASRDGHDFPVLDLKTHGLGNKAQIFPLDGEGIHHHAVRRALQGAHGRFPVGDTLQTLRISSPRR